MTILAIIIIGGLVGWLAARLMGRDEGILASILIGIVGAFLGSFLSSLIIGSGQSYFSLSWTGVFWSLVGSVILVAILNAITSRRNVAPRGL